MNIFYLDNDLEKSARYHVDRHVVKMLLEYAQLLSTTHWVTGSEGWYKKTHVNHPSAVWARQSRENYLWLCCLGLEVAKEYEYRYGRKHKSSYVIEWAKDNVPDLPSLGWTQPTPAMPDEYKVPGDSLQSYRNYYKLGKSHLHSWKFREVPQWLN